MSFPLKKITEFCYAVMDENSYYSNAGAIVLPEFIFVVDPLYIPSHAQEFRKSLSRFNVPVKYIFLTHYHGDHIFGLNAFKDISSIAHKNIIKNLARRMNSDWSRDSLDRHAKEDPAEDGWMADADVLVPEITFDKKMYIYNKYNFQTANDLSIKIFHTGGHTDCSGFVYFPHDKVIFAGDLLFTHQFPYGGDATCNPDEWIDALKLLLSLDVEYYIPGHGNAVDREEVKKQLVFFHALKEAVLTGIKKNKSASEIKCPDYYEFNQKYASLKAKSIEHWYRFFKG